MHYEQPQQFEQQPYPSSVSTSGSSSGSTSGSNSVSPVTVEADINMNKNNGNNSDFKGNNSDPASVDPPTAVQQHKENFNNHINHLNTNKPIFSPTPTSSHVIPGLMMGGAKTPFPPTPETGEAMRQYKNIGFPPMSGERSNEKIPRVLTPCNQWERSQFVQSPPMMMSDQSPGEMRLTPLGEPHLAEWFASMEDGMFLGVGGEGGAGVGSPLKFVGGNDGDRMTD